MSNGVVSRIVATILLLALVLYTMRRWRLPFGSVTLVFTTLSAFMLFLFYDRTSPGLAAAPVVAGVVADAFLRWRRSRLERPATVLHVTPGEEVTRVDILAESAQAQE